MKSLVPLLLTFLLTSAAAAQPQIIGHRGAAGLAPENTLEAVRKAIELGANGTEIDVHLSADGEVVVHHDYRLNPDMARRDGAWLASPGPALHSIDAFDLRHYDIGAARPGSEAAERYPEMQPVEDARIPTLLDVLDVVRTWTRLDFRLFIDLRIDPTQPDISSPMKALVDAVIEAVRSRRMRSRVRLISLYWPALYYVHETSPGMQVGFLTVERDWLDNLQIGEPGPSPWTAPFDIDAVGGSVPQAIRANGGGVWLAYADDMTPERRAAAREAGVRIGLWPVRERAEIEKIRALDPNFIITDRPDWFIERY